MCSVYIYIGDEGVERYMLGEQSMIGLSVCICVSTKRIHLSWASDNSHDTTVPIKATLLNVYMGTRCVHSLGTHYRRIGFGLAEGAVECVTACNTLWHCDCRN